MIVHYVMGIDPGSYRTGYAVFRLEVSDHGSISMDVELVNGGILSARDNDPYKRIDIIIHDFLSLVNDVEPDHIAIETTTGKTAGRLKGEDIGTGIYGVAVGALWREALRTKARVYTYRENVWTHGKKKEERLGKVALLFPNYKVEDDKKGDVGDAIGVGLYNIESEFKKVQFIG